MKMIDFDDAVIITDKLKKGYEDCCNVILAKTGKRL